MKKFGSIILVLALVLALFPMTALADDAFNGVTVYVVGLEKITSNPICKEYTPITGTTLTAIVGNATTWAGGTGNFDSIQAIIFNGGLITVNDSYTVPSGPKIVFNNTAVTVKSGGTLNMREKALLLGSTVTAEKGSTVNYGKTKNIGASGNIIIDSADGTVVLKFSKDGNAFSSLASVVYADIEKYFINDYKISLDMTFNGNFTIGNELVLNYYDIARISQNSTITVDTLFAATDGSEIINDGTITGSGTLRTGDAIYYNNATSVSPKITNGSTGVITTSMLRIKSAGIVSNSGKIGNGTQAIEMENASVLNNYGTVNVATIETKANTDAIQKPQPHPTGYAKIDNRGNVEVDVLTNARGDIDNYSVFKYGPGSTGLDRIRDLYNYGGYYGGFQGTTGPSMTASTGTYAGGNLYFSTSGMFGQFRSLTAGGVTLNNGTDYTVENRGGYAYITVFESALTGLSGNVRFTAAFSDGSASAYVTMGYYVPDEIVLDPPKTGDAANLMGLGFIFIACALAVVTRKVRARAK